MEREAEFPPHGILEFYRLLLVISWGRSCSFLRCRRGSGSFYLCLSFCLTCSLSRCFFLSCFFFCCFFGCFGCCFSLGFSSSCCFGPLLHFFSLLGGPSFSSSLLLC